jgi:hypothetical protein
MALGKDNSVFQGRFYVVGTGVVRIPANWGAGGGGTAFRSYAADRRGQRRNSARRGAGSSGWLVRLLEHLKTSIASHRA